MPTGQPSPLCLHAGKIANMEPDLDRLMLIGGRPMLYSRLYQPMTLREFLDCSPFHTGYSRLAEHYIAGYRISTVWLNCDMRWGNFPPVQYETMIFSPTGDVVTSFRYSWEPDAYEGHRYAIEWLWQRLPLGTVRALPRGVQ